MLREARFVDAVEAAGAPVPRILATGEAGEVFDVPFYIMEMVEGVVVTDRLPPSFDDPSAGRAMAYALVDAMADLHRIDWSSSRVAELAKPDGFNARHLRVFTRMVEIGEGAIEPAFEPVHAWLAANVPEESGAAIIHNDLRLGNVMWRPNGPPKLAAILDWELAAVGDPLLDLAYLLSSMPRDGRCRTPVQDLSAALLSETQPTTADLAARYFARTGTPAHDIAWYQAMVNWKLAVLYRHSRHRGNDPYFADPSHEERFLLEASHYCD